MEKGPQYLEERSETLFGGKECIRLQKDELLLDSLVEHTRKKRNDCKSLLKYKSVQVNGEVQTYHAFELHPGDEVKLVRRRIFLLNFFMKMMT